ncbi:MAG TPA: hypothetical protein VH968_00160 [Gaiellaceae bacterium]|jgi:hypothetical protein
MTGAALFDSLRARRALREARREADAELLDTPVPSLRLAWRAAELVVPKERRELAGELRRLVRYAEPRYLPGAAPVNRPGVRAAGETLLAMADRLADLEQPVSPRGVLLLERLLSDGDGPLYDPVRTDELLAAIDEAAGALDLP